MSLSATLLVNARTERSITDMQENRTREFGLKELAENDTANLLDSAEIAEDRTLESRTVQIPVLQRLSATLKTARACDFTGTDSTSALQSITWNTAGFVTTMTPVEHRDNNIAMQRKFTHQLQAGIRTVCNDIESKIYTTLNTNRTQVLTNPVDAIIPFSTGVDELQVPNSDKTRMWNYIKYIMKENAFDGKFNVAASWGLWPEVDYYINQGSGNSANTSFQFGDYNFYGSAGITNSGSNQGTFFVMPVGSVAIVYWVPKQGQLGGTSADGNGRLVYGTADVPMLGTMQTKEQVNCVDISATYPGMTDALQYVTEYSFDYAVIPLYNSSLTTLENAIVKGVLLEGESGS